MNSIAFDKKSIAVDMKSNGSYRNSTRHYEIDMKSIAFDTKSKTKLQIIDKNSIALDKEPIAFDTKSNRNCRTSIRIR